MTQSALQDRLTVKANGEDREIFMSYGLLNTLCGIVGGVENIGQTMIDHEIREEMLKALLVKRKPSGKIIEGEGSAIDPDDLEISKEDLIKVIKWGTAHVLDFFTMSAEATKDLVEQNAEKLKVLTSSTSGSESSAS